MERGTGMEVLEVSVSGNKKVNSLSTPASLTVVVFNKLLDGGIEGNSQTITMCLTENFLNWKCFRESASNIFNRSERRKSRCENSH